MYVHTLLTGHPVKNWPNFRNWRSFRNLMNGTILNRTYVHIMLSFMMRKVLIDTLVHFCKRKTMMITVIKSNRILPYWKIHRIFKMIVTSWVWRIFRASCAIELLALRLSHAVIYSISIGSRTMGNYIIIFKSILSLWIERCISVKWTTRSHFNELILLILSFD
jgi:hypothetical protein